MKKQFVAMILGALPLLGQAADNQAVAPALTPAVTPAVTPAAAPIPSAMPGATAADRAAFERADRLAVSRAAAAAAAANRAANESPADAYFSKQNPQLTAQEKNAIAIAQKWQAAGSDGSGMRPVGGPNGVVRFVYGVQQINIVCAVLQVCDVELQPGEQVNNLNMGDPRFTVEPAISGTGAGEMQHLIIKPLDVGLDTTLIVTTNRRTYRMKLRSHRTQFMPYVGFTYPEEAAAKWDAMRTREVREKAEQTIPQTKEVLSELSFKYRVDGDAAWKPVRVYNDGVRTIIQMPAVMSQTEAPTLLVIRKEGGLFTDAEEVQVNYRVHGDRFIVDNVFNKAVLIAGVGRGQDRVTITKEK
jgi:P-type conjugative transfer protein TrbG